MPNFVGENNLSQILSSIAQKFNEGGNTADNAFIGIGKVIFRDVPDIDRPSIDDKVNVLLLNGDILNNIPVFRRGGDLAPTLNGSVPNAWHVAVVKANGAYFAFVIGHTRTLPQYEMMQSRMLNAAINSREADNNGKVEIGEFDGIFNANLPVNFM
jgi:hypothetical protein